MLKIIDSDSDTVIFWQFDQFDLFAHVLNASNPRNRPQIVKW